MSSSLEHNGAPTGGGTKTHPSSSSRMLLSSSVIFRLNGRGGIFIHLPSIKRTPKPGKCLSNASTSKPLSSIRPDTLVSILTRLLTLLRTISSIRIIFFGLSRLPHLCDGLCDTSTTRNTRPPDGRFDLIPAKATSSATAARNTVMDDHFFTFPGFGLGRLPRHLGHEVLPQNAETRISLFVWTLIPQLVCPVPCLMWCIIISSSPLPA